MKIILFLRKPYNDFHSIENIFTLIEKRLKEDIDIKKVQSPYYSKGIILRLQNIWSARKNQGLINHISGDNNYIAIGLKKNNTILTIHSFDKVVGEGVFKKFLYRLFWFRLPIHSVKYVTVVSEFLKKEIAGSIKGFSKDARVIYNPVNPVFQKSYKSIINKSCPNLLQIGTFDVKNLNQLIFAIKDIRCHLRIVGRLSYQQQQQLDINNIEYSNTFDLSATEMLKEYQIADIVTFVSTYEGFGMPIIEANAVGRVVITSNVAAMPEVANNAALMVNPYDIQEIRNGILKLINDDNYRNQLIENGFENAKRFDVNVIAQQYFELYKEVANT